MDYNKLMSIADKNRTKMEKMLQEWIRIPSVKGEATKTAPMGEEVGKMLEKAIYDCNAMGFNVRNFDGYACDVRMGKIDENPLAILAHIDVVPTGDGWELDPFGADIIDGNMYGRGTTDDKGPAIAALFAMFAVKQANINLKREVRLILGTDEESGWAGMDYYMEHCDMPKSGFSPDACFPLINTEKGLLHMELNAKPSKDGIQIIKLYTGERPNVIPGKCEALLKGGKDIAEKIKSFTLKENIKNEVILNENNTILLKVEGIPGHAAMPEGASSAIGKMLSILKYLGVEGPVKTIAELIGSQTNGKALGIAIADDASGELTLNMGILRIDSEKIYATLDMRFPLLASSDAIIKRVKFNMKQGNIDASVTECKQPHHVPENSALVQGLLKAYNDETGLPKKAIAIGGGTYARCLSEGVAFGSNFPDDEELAHQAGEYINLDTLMKNVRIFIRAIIELAGE